MRTGMAKGSEDASPPVGPVRSVLRAAWDRFEAGDVAEARRLARAALGGARGPDEDQAARELAAALEGTPGLAIEPTVASVARALMARAQPPPRGFLFAALALAIGTGLVVLALTRYAS